uniref:hypothetical protein n=1 Tax=unclassified Rhodococcus (in: high G+C Gram-positive bacteria) TaxID=192944 RepID=UPI0011407C8A|nr:MULTISPECIES: hypothetical protein [unclassified Rhodococcus (in: high G+C Gram-positive bacteria)]
MAKERPPENRPRLDRIPRVKSAPLAELPDDHLLIALAHIASSSKGLHGKYAGMMGLGPMLRYAPTLEKLQADTRGLHKTEGGRAEARRLADAAIVDLAQLCTPGDAEAGRLLARIAQRRRNYTIGA